MATKIRLKRLGKIRSPHYRIIVIDSRAKRDGRAIEEIGKYHPTEEPSLIEIDSERAQYWLSVGAQPSDAVMAQLKVTGDWQKFKGLDGAEGTLRTKDDSAEAAAKAQEAVKAAEAEAEKRKAKAAEAKAAAEAEKAAEASAQESADGEDAATGAPADEATEQQDA